MTDRGATRRPRAKAAGGAAAAAGFSLESFRDHPWEKTPLGPRAAWPEVLARTVELLLDSKQPMFLAWGPEHLFLFNPPLASLLGARAAEALGQPFRRLFATSWSQVGPLFERAFAGEGVLAEDQPLSTWASGHRDTRFYSFSYTPVRADGAVAGILGICTDTTEKIRAETRLKKQRDGLLRIFEQTPGFIAMTAGPDHRFTFANATYRRIAGSDDLAGRTVAEVLPELVPQGFIAILDEVFATGIPFRATAMPLRLRRADGGEETRFFDFIYHPRTDAEGAISGLFCEGHDVTEQVRAAEHVQTLQNELIHVSRLSAMGAMAATLAHELNQPLTAIANYAAAVRRFVAAGEMDEVEPGVEAIRQGALRAGEVIRGLRAMTEKRSAPIQQFELREAVEGVLRLAMLGAECALRWDFEAGLTVAGDRIQIQQVMLNLVRNAIEAMAGCERRILGIAGRACGAEVRVTVSDTGPGIAFDPIDSVFDFFASTKAEGMGVGLSISRTIVEGHGGRIWAANDPKGGAAFHFTLPRAGRVAAGSTAPGPLVP